MGMRKMQPRRKNPRQRKPNMTCAKSTQEITTNPRKQAYIDNKQKQIAKLRIITPQLTQQETEIPQLPENPKHTNARTNKSQKHEYDQTFRKRMGLTECE